MSLYHQELILPEILDQSRKVWRNFSAKFFFQNFLFVCLLIYILLCSFVFILLSEKHEVS